MDPVTMLKRNYDTLTKAEQRLADYILSHPRCVLDGLGISDISKAARSSNAALVRLCQKLGYKGYSEFKYSMHRYLLAQGAERGEESGEGPAAPDPMHNTIETYVRYLRRIPDCVNTDDLRRAAQSICTARHISIWGFNRTFQSAKQLSNRLGRLGIFNQVTDDWVVMADDAEILAQGDLCILISTMGRGIRGRENTLRTLRERGCKIILICMNPKQPAAEYADLVFALPWISHDAGDNFFEDQVIVYLFLELLLYEVAKLYPG